ncbi:MAG: pyroglutamyl-peptidase I [Oscillospiraceae bacterium]|nr:pyroglutamyl-peptidase I [Oscillospiraceae bacterium]
MKILVTGFDPFGGDSVNPALELIKQLPEEIDGCEIITLEVPTVFHKSIQVIKQAIDTHHPDAVLSVGQAGGRVDMTVERIGINCDDARIPDNEGNSPVDEKVFEDGDDAYLLTLPVKAMVKAIQDAGVPASVSNTAGTFVCNHVAYGVAYLAKKYYPDMKTGFMHIPFMPYQAAEKRGMPSMSLESLKTGTVAAIKAIIANEKDIKLAFGAEH